MKGAFQIQILIIFLFICGSATELNLLMFTDMHFGENSLKDLQTMAMQNFLIKTVKPDFVVLNGDQMSNYAWQWYNYQRDYTNYTRIMHEQYTLALIKNQQNYALILGNHDSGADMSRDQVIDMEVGSSPYSFTKGTDYYLMFDEEGSIIKDDNERVPSFILWFFDSHDRGCETSTESWGCVGKEQIDWFKQSQVQLISKYGDHIISAVQVSFIHIPIDEFMTLYNTCKLNTSYQIEKVFGNRGENIACPLVNTQIFQALRDGGIKAIFSGHDHHDDFGGVLEGVKLVYGRKTGFGGYGPQAGVKRGARIITLKTGNGVKEVSTRIIEQDGNIVDNEGQSSFRKDKLEQCSF